MKVRDLFIFTTALWMSISTVRILAPTALDGRMLEVAVGVVGLLLSELACVVGPLGMAGVDCLPGPVHLPATALLPVVAVVHEVIGDRHGQQVELLAREARVS